MDDLFDKIICLLNETLYRDPPIAILAHSDMMARFLAEFNEKSNIYVERVAWRSVQWTVIGLPVSRYDALPPTSLAFVGRTETRVFNMNNIDQGDKTDGK